MPSKVSSPSSPCGLQTSSADSKVQPPEKTASRAKRACSWSWQQVVAPVDRTLQGSLASRHAAAAGTQDRQPIQEAGEDLSRFDHPDPAGDQLDGEWQAVEPEADVGHGCSVLWRQRECRLHRPGAVDEQGDGGNAANRVLIEPLAGGRQGERRDREFLLPIHVQGAAAGGQDTQAG